MGKGSQKRPSRLSRAEMDAKWDAAFGPRHIETAADASPPVASEAIEERDPYWVLSGYRGEYLCSHGVGHGNHVHGCCQENCCTRPDFPLRGAPTND